ncbi:MAG: helix-turn-helix transcriptional regulator [Oscillospiraceae bacterium]|nr:helix-turn-helix transcriptional regulator [Oscillospiraceae bacterium]
MMTTAYNELYLDDAMSNLGDMIEYAVCDLGFDADEFFGWFISSGIASKFEKGNPKYITGMSGYELADAVITETNIKYEKKEPSYTDFKGREYWAGWILAYYQWKTNKRFEDIVNNGLTLSTVFSMYILHEADVSKFVEAANEVIARNKKVRKSKLHEIRKARGFTQQELSDASGVTLRMIQLYEQKQNDISKAQAGVVISLAKALGCEAEDLLE